MKDKLSRGSLFFLHLSKNETQGRREGFETRRGVERRNDEEGGRTTKTQLRTGIGSESGNETQSGTWNGTRSGQRASESGL